MTLNAMTVANKKHGIVFLLIPLALSSFAHLWNPAGFPDIFYDEGVYMRRAMHVLEGHGPQESSFYDHPYFGQLFLAGLLAITGYPDSLGITPSVQSIESLYAVPRIWMGILAVADTFLIYMISARQYGKRVALISSILFAVMPITWLTRRILLDSILLPFLLASILFAVYAKSATGSKKSALVLLSGIFLGTAMFTKIPTFTMIPLVGYLVYSSSTGSGKPRLLGLWFIPVILIPMIWPIYSIANDQFDLWQRDVVWQTQRQSEGFTSIIGDFLFFDPVLLILGAAGFVYAAVKKEFFVLLWIIPFVAFMSVIGYVQYFYWIPVLPVFSIAGARMIDKMSVVKQRLPFAAIAAIGIFGLVSTALLVTTNVTSAQFDAAALVAGSENGQTTIVSSPVYSWIFIYVFDKEHTLTDYRDLLFYPIETRNMLLISDEHFKYNLGGGRQLQEAYDNTTNIAIFEGNVSNYNLGQYPYTNMAANYEGSNVEVRASK